MLERMFSWESCKKPILALAPMAGYTDSPFRRIVKEICPSAICFTEFTSIDGLLHDSESTFRQVTFDSKKERPVIAQIFGKQPEKFKQAAQILTKLGVDAIDINMGCPARKIVSSDHGSALLKNKKLAAEIVRAAAENTHAPVSVKMRTGMQKYDENYFLDFALEMEKSGAKLITVHGRTSKQMYSGNADWNPIYKLKKLAKIPIVGNGDIKSGRDAIEKLQNLDGVMVGRSAMGNPWIFAEIAAAFANKPFRAPSFQEKLPIIKKHLELSCEFKGQKWGIMEFRKHISCYIRGFPNASGFRQQLVTAETKDEVISILNKLRLP